MKVNRITQYANLAGAALLALAATQASAALIAYEPYNYPLAAAPTYVSGTPTPTAGGGFGSGYNGGGLTTVAGLTYPGLGVNYNALKQTAAYSGENLSSPVSSGTVYVSYLFNMSGNPGGNKVGLEMNTGGNGMFVGVTTPVTGSTGKLGVNQQQSYNDSFANKWESSTANITYGSNYFIVVKLTGTGSGWTGSIWVNPTANTGSEPAPDGTFTMPQFTISACSIVNPAGAGGNFVFDELRLATTWAEAVTYTIAAPSAPTGLSATPGGNSVSLSWTAAAGSPVSYNVKRSTTSGSGYVAVSSPGAVTSTNFTDLVAGGSNYYYVVSAVNAGGESGNSSEVSASPTLVAPAAPTGLTASASDGQVSLSWVASIAASGYNVKRSTTSGTEVTIANVGTTSYTDATVANGTTYFYVVSATNSVGEGANSSEVSASPIAYVAAYESFNYSVGNLTNNTPGTGTGEAGNWVIGTPAAMPTIVSPGLSYSGLPTANNAYQHTASGNQNYINLATASQLSSGTKYLSYLMKGSGNSGGDTVGAYFKGNNATSLFVGFRAPNSASLTGFGLGTVNSTTLGGASALGSVVNISNNVVHLIVLKIDFNTSGANDTVSLWIDPPAGTNAPGVAANITAGTFDVGTISAVGINITGGYAARFDEFRTGNTYGDVVGAPNPTVPTALALSVAAGKQISWSAQSTNYYQPQSSPDNATWVNLGAQLVGSVVTSVYDSASAAYYQVLEDTPVVAEAVQNGGFETDDGGAGALNWSSVQSQPPTRTTSGFHTGSACMDLFVTNTTAGANGAEIQQNVANAGGSIIAGNTYVLSFWAKQVSSGASYVQNYKITWMDGVTPISSVGFTPFTGGSGTWTQISTGPIVAPASANSALIQIYGATGAVLGGYGEVLIDDVLLTTTSPSGSPTVIASTVQSGAVFTATVKTNGATATAATGTVAFKTNSVAQSLGSVSAGIANSSPTTVPASYTITAIYSGDATYIGSTTTLVVGGGPSGSALLTNSVSGGVLSLSWPASQGWRLQMQTNSLASGLSTNWIYVSDGMLSSTNIPVDGSKPAVFYRLTYP